MGKAYRMRQLALMLFIGLIVVSGAHGETSSVDPATVGLTPFFAKLKANEPVTVVAIGGSITMHTTGWSKQTADLIRKDYPNTPVKFINAGVSGTGSNLAVFRLRRDVIAHRPDIVFIEFAVNDGGAPDVACIRNLESIVVRLQQCAKPPAIVFVESASKTGVNQKRHNQVAAHYGLLDVDMQATVEKYMQANKLKWDDLFGDAVHPKNPGHALYAQTLWQQIKQFESQSVARKIDHNIKPLSQDGLILDGELIMPNYQQNGWHYRAEKINGWWRKFFAGSMQTTDKPGMLHLPFYGRTIGLWMLIKEGRGHVRVLVDGKLIKEVSAFRPDWYYGQFVHTELFDDGWHVLSLIPTGVNDQPAIARVGYLLASDQTHAPEPASEFWKTTWENSIKQAHKVATIQWDVVPTKVWQILGPFGGEAAKPYENPKEDLDGDFGVMQQGKPDMNRTYIGYQNRQLKWAVPSKGENGWVDLRNMYNLRDHGVAYAHVQINADKAGA